MKPKKKHKPISGSEAMITATKDLNDAVDRWLVGHWFLHGWRAGMREAIRRERARAKRGG